MNKLIKTFLIGVVVLIMAQPVPVLAGGGEPVTVSGKTLFVIKADKKLVGGKIEILSADGDLVTIQVLRKRKMIIDFGDIAKGAYTIRVSKGDRVEEYQYNKKK